MSRILSIDYGLKRIGIAVTDPERIIASPLITLSQKEFLPFIEDYINRENVKIIVLGYPQDVDQDLLIVKKIKEVYNYFTKHYEPIKVILYDERYTSKMAYQGLIKNFKKKQRSNKENIDKMSAAIILQSYMSSKLFQENS